MPANSAFARSHRLFVVGGYAILLAGAVLLGVVPYKRQRSSIESNISSLQRDINERLNSKRQLDDIQRRVQLIKLQTNNYGRLVPPAQDLGVFVEQLSNELSQARMKNVMVRAMPANTLGKTQKLPIEVSGSGTFAQVRQFLEKLEGLPRMSTVGRLSVDAASDIDGSVDMQLTLFIYNTKPSP